MDQNISRTSHLQSNLLSHRIAPVLLTFPIRSTTISPFVSFDGHVSATHVIFFTFYHWYSPYFSTCVSHSSSIVFYSDLSLSILGRVHQYTDDSSTGKVIPVTLRTSVLVKFKCQNFKTHWSSLHTFSLSLCLLWLSPHK